MALSDMLLGIAGNVISCLMFAAALPTFWRIFRNKSTEDFKALPYVVALLSVLMWVFYGCIIKDGTLVITINVIGIIFETLYLTLYLIYAPRNKSRWIISGVQAGILAVLVVYGAILAISLSAFHGDKRKLLVGTICAVISVSMYASPLGIVKLVIQTKSVEYMPFTLSLFLFINGAVWSAYAIVTHDVFIIIPNGIGCFLGAMQLIIYGYYSPGCSRATPERHEADVEKGSFFDLSKGNVLPVTSFTSIGHKEDTVSPPSSVLVGSPLPSTATN